MCFSKYVDGSNTQQINYDFAAAGMVDGAIQFARQSVR